MKTQAAFHRNPCRVIALHAGLLAALSLGLPSAAAQPTNAPIQRPVAKAAPRAAKKPLPLEQREQAALAARLAQDGLWRSLTNQIAQVQKQLARNQEETTALIERDRAARQSGGARDDAAFRRLREERLGLERRLAQLTVQRFDVEDRYRRPAKAQPLRF